jgi:CRP-like cAMP-binding protein
LFTDEAPDETEPEAPPWEMETPQEFAGPPLDEEDQMMVSARDSEIFTVSDEQDKHLSYVDILAATYHDGEIIFEEGDPGDEMYFIEEGKVKIVGSYKDTKKILITYEKGDFFGEMILFGGKTRSARAVALGTTRLIPVTRETLASQIQVKPEIALALLETLSNRIRKNTRTISKLADQNKELMHRLRKAHTTMKQLIEQNKQLQQSASDGGTS